MSRRRRRCCRQASVGEALAAAKLQHERSCIAGNVPAQPRCVVPSHACHRAMNNSGACTLHERVGLHCRRLRCRIGNGRLLRIVCAAHVAATRSRFRVLLDAFQILTPNLRTYLHGLIDLRKENQIAALLGHGGVGAIPW
ncbi:conserved hypothetical protein [Xanthomonas citri pv. fuscans]|nr:conserved hypothetical protein [Xanthomonas citri pv. fuscans]SOO31608.1 conserved hypothetical protein [Xanthomonas citri pv. fuscans]